MQAFWTEFLFIFACFSNLFPKMVVKQTEPVRPAAPVLNGRQAELADPDYQSEDEEEEGTRLKKPTQHKFAQPDHMKLLLESKLIRCS